MINARYKKLSGTHAGHSYAVVAPYGEIENPLRWMLHCETDEAEKLVVAEDELNNPKVWLPLS